MMISEFHDISLTTIFNFSQGENLNKEQIAAKIEVIGFVSGLCQALMHPLLMALLESPGTILQQDVKQLIHITLSLSQPWRQRRAGT
jgi:hypothetical protein